MTSAQRVKLLEALREGKSLSTARNAARITKTQLSTAVDEDDSLLEAIELAEAQASIAAHAALVPAPPPVPLALLPTPTPRILPTPEDSDELPRLDGDKIAQEAARFGAGPMGYLLWMDSLFTAHGQPPLSPWWKWSLEQWFESQKTWGLYQVGRGGGKSTSLERVSILFVEFGCRFAPRKVPPGQRWIWPFVSVSTQDATRRIQEIRALLLALGLEVKIKDYHGRKLIELTDVDGNELSFESIAATIGGVSGPSAVGGTVDEEAKLRDRAQHVNPSTEILASFGQMFRARPGIRAIRCSSAFKEAGSHYASMKEGDTDATFVATLGEPFVPIAVQGLLDVAGKEKDAHAAETIRAYAATITGASKNIPTWVANPTISALASRMLAESIPVEESDKGLPRWRYWLRENASVAMPVSMVAAGDFSGLAEANRKLSRGSSAHREALLKFDSVKDSYDPRSSRYKGPGDGGECL